MALNRFILKSAFLVGLLIVSLFVSAQPISWKESPGKTFVYKLSNKEALSILKGRLKKTKLDKILNSPFDSFSATWAECPVEGHFLFATIEKNKVNYSYYPMIPFHVFLFKEYGVLTLQVVDADGNIREDAKVRLGHHSVQYDKESQTYTEDDWSEKEQRILTVELNKFRAVFDLRKHFVPSWYGNGYDEAKSKPDFYSYLITDKNKYKPGETVRFKSYSLSEHKRPLKDELLLGIRDDNYRFKPLTTVAPYHPGGFAGEFQLADSLKLKLDRPYTIQLRDKRGRIVATTNFRYEDYELTGNELRIKLHNSIQYAPQANRLEITATDANGLFLQEVQAEVTVRRREVLHSYTDILILPDTLWTKRVDLNISESTFIDISPGIFGLSDCSYEVSVLLLTFDNRRMEKREAATFYHSNYGLRYTTVKDSIRFAFSELGVERSVDNPAKVELMYFPVVNANNDGRVVEVF